LKKWKECMYLVAKRDFEDMAEAMISKDALSFTPPAIPKPPQEPPLDSTNELKATYAQQLHVFELSTKPAYQSSFKVHLKRMHAYATDTKKLYAVIMLHLSEESKNRIKAQGTEFQPIQDASDGVALFKLACSTHIFNGGDKWTQQQHQLGIISTMKQGTLPLEVHLTLLREQMEYLEEIDAPLTESDAISRTIMSLNKSEFGPFITDRSIAGTLPKTFALLVTALLHYAVTMKSVKDLYGAPASKQTGWSETTNLVDDEEINLAATPKRKSRGKPKTDLKAEVDTENSKDSGASNKPTKSCAWCRSRGKTYNNHYTDDCGHMLRFLANEGDTEKKKDK